MSRLGSSLLPFAAGALLAGGVARAQPSSEREFWNPLCVTPTGQPSLCSESPSTTFVITADEVRHSGASSLPEILRRVPGLDVRTMAATDGQLGLRGFAYEISEKILVLVDGRTVYFDFFGGTSFEMLPVSLVDIERIEVVLGPGASVYGNKAMLGTINIITRSAADYPYAEARVDVGPPGDGRVGARYGAIRGPWRLRATGVGRRLTPFETDVRSASSAGGGTLSASYSPSAGAEASFEVGGVQGDTYIIPTGARVDRFDGTVGYARAQGRLGLGGAGAPYGSLNLDLVWNGGHLHSATFPSTSAPFEATYHTPYARLHHELRTEVFGVPMQGRWGTEVRLNTLESTITSRERPLWNVAAFASDELLLGRWRFTAGLRVDRSTLTDVSFSPRVSVVWSPVEHHQLRAAFNTGYNNAQALHYFADLQLNSSTHVRGDPDLRAEHAVYGELGWTGVLIPTRSRAPVLRAFTTVFVYRFSDWISLDPESATPVSATSASMPYGNNPAVDIYGGEAGLDVTLRRGFSAYASYALMAPRGPGAYPYNVAAHGSPRDKVSAGVRLSYAGGAYLSVDAQYFGPSAVARVPQTPTPGAANPFEQTVLQEFVMSHVRVGYASTNGFDVSLAAANALDDRTPQFARSEAPARRVMATLAYYR